MKKRMLLRSHSYDCCGLRALCCGSKGEKNRTPRGPVAVRQDELMQGEVTDQHQRKQGQAGEDQDRGQRG